MPDTKEIYRVFSPLPLRPDQEALYVSLNVARGGQEIVHRIAEQIRLSDEQVSQVLAGHKGSGKSTELMRLKKHLESEAGGKFFVVYCNADSDIDRNDVDFPEILIAIVRQLAAQVKEHAGVLLKPGYFQDRWQRLKEVLTSEVSFEKLELASGMLKISSIIKDSPDARRDIREILEPDTTNWLYAANDAIGTASFELQKRGYKGLVVIVDDLDKMVIRPLDHAGCSTAEHLFINRAAQLTAFHCHMVYTLPLSLAYSHHEQAIKASFGGHVPVVPMVKVTTPPPKRKAYSPGTRLMQEMIERRCASVGAETKAVFRSAGVMRELIRLSGGQPSELMAMIREAIVASDLPVDSAGLTRV